MSRSKWIRSEEKVRIIISKDTHKRLKNMKYKNECFDDVIRRLLDIHPKITGY